jgi:predicted nuclease of predicted toxin-antitoxin system
MKLYLDDDTASGLLLRLLRQAGHDVQIPTDVGMSGNADPVHLTYAIRDGRVLLSKNYDDFAILHVLIMQAQGHHPGILVIRQDNDPTRDLTPKGVVRAIRNLEGAGAPVADEYTILNAWR